MRSTRRRSCPSGTAGLRMWNASPGRNRRSREETSTDMGKKWTTAKSTATAVLAILSLMAAGCVSSGDSEEAEPPTETLAVPADAPATEDEVGAGGAEDGTDAAPMGECSDLVLVIYTLANDLTDAFDRHFGDETFRAAVTTPEPQDPAGTSPVPDVTAQEFRKATTAIRSWINGPNDHDKRALRLACYLNGLDQAASEKWDAGSC